MSATGFPGRRAARREAAALLAVLAIGCVDLKVAAPSVVAAVIMVPDTVALRVGDSAVVKADPIDATSAFVSQATPTWSSSSAAIATVDASGLVKGKAPGTATITASVGSVNGTTVALISGPPATMVVTAGNGQTAAVNTIVATPPSVKLTDAGGNPVANVAVTFAVTKGGGTVSPATPALTNFNGVATATSWTLGPSAGPDSLTATASDSGVAGNPAKFGATATVGSPNAANSTVSASPGTIAPSSGQSFTTITVTVKDSVGSTISGATVSLSATGSGNILTQPTDTTNSSGQATGALSSSVAETKTITAKVNGTVTVLQTATVTVTPSVAAGLVVATAAAGAVSNAAFATQPVVEIRDAFGNRIMTATDPITVSLVSGNGTLASPGSFTVNAVQGRATFSGLKIKGPGASGDTLGTGTQVLQFGAPGYAAVVDTVVVGVSFAYNIQNIFGRSCNGCHSFTYTTPAGTGVVNQPTTFSCAGRTRVVPSDTTNSFLYEKVKTATPSCGGYMPPTPSSILSTFQARLIRDWILQGALNN